MAWSQPTGWVTQAIALDGLATSASATSTTTFDNSTVRDIYLDVSLRLAAITPSSSAPAVEVHLLPILDDGSTIADIVRASDYISTTKTNSAKNIGVLKLVIAPGQYRIAIVNQTGVAFATGNTLAIRTYSPA